MLIMTQAQAEDFGLEHLDMAKVTILTDAQMQAHLRNLLG
jgi:hypothetical protein